MHNSLHQEIRNLLINSVSGVHSIFYGNKITNGEQTDEMSLVYFVEKKLPLNEIPVNERIPSQITLNDIAYKTDVIQSHKFVLTQCYNLSDTAPRFLQGRIRPLIGGIEISSLASWSQPSPNSFRFGVGTLGFLAIDNTDNKLVGVTNAHVVVQDCFLNDEKNSSDPISSLIDPIVFSQPNGFNATLNPGILQFGSYDGNVNFATDFIGLPKRYTPISEYGYNNVDAALITIKQETVDSSSNQQALLPNSYGMPFATTSEIQSLSSNSTPIYSVGRTTGPKGTNCPLVVYTAGSTYIDFDRQQTSVQVLMSDVMSYRFLDNSNLPIYNGDSGSAIIGDFLGTYKIVGLAFAGNTYNHPVNGPTSTYGLACRIDNIAQKLNISPWDGSTASFNDPNVNNVLKIYRPLNDTRESITYNGKTYFQAGTVRTNEPDTNV